jgi:hypothetical protein
MATMSDLVAKNGKTSCSDFVPRFLKGLGDKVFNDIMRAGNPNANALYSAWSQNENLVNLNTLIANGGFGENVNVQEMAAEMANYYANQGYLVLAAASDGGGHVAIVAPQDQKFDFLPSVPGFPGTGKDANQGRAKPTVMRDYPVFLQAGTNTGRVPPGYAFSRDMIKDGHVIFFVYKPLEE